MPKGKKNIPADSTALDNTLQQENENLKNELLELRQLVLGLTRQLESKPDITPPVKSHTPVIEEDVIPEIPMGKIVKVMSLYNGGLNLKTSEESGAVVYRFEKVGQTLPIVYSDLVKIISNQRRFFVQGLCMILDKNVVRSHALEEEHQKMVDGKTINEILSYDKSKIHEIFSNVLPGVQQTIVEIVIEKINSGEYYDKNKVDVISAVYGRDVIELARNSK